MSESSESILQLEQVDAHYRGVQALADVSLSLAAGEIIALMGPNGAGKSTILKTIFGLVPVSGGKILWHGTPVKPISYEMVERGLSFVPQGRRTFTHLTVEENLEMGAFTIKNKSEMRRRRDELFLLFPALKAKRRARAGTLSGGQQQMVALARGLMTDPKVLLLDEPSLGLAPKIVKEIFAQIKLINEHHGTAIVIVEHNLKSALEIVDRAYVLDKGAVVAEGAAKKIVASGVLEKVFLGR